MLNTSNSLFMHYERQKDGQEFGAQIKICFKTEAKLLCQCNWRTTVKDNHKNSESRPLKFSPMMFCMPRGCCKQFTCWLLSVHSCYGNPTIYLKRLCHWISQSQWSTTASAADSSSGLRLLAYYFFVQAYYLAISQSVCWKATKHFRKGQKFILHLCSIYYSVVQVGCNLYLYCNTNITCNSISLNYILVQIWHQTYVFCGKANVLWIAVHLFKS